MTLPERKDPPALPPEIRAIWTDLYQFHVAFARMGNTPEEWERCAREMGDRINRHSRHPLATTLFLALYEYLSEERKPLAREEAIRRAADHD